MAASPTREDARPQDIKNKKHCLESKVCLRHSILWRLQEAFYQANGEAAWTDQVPSFISSNAKLAKDYARLIFHFLRDIFAPANHSAGKALPSGPCLILEIGGGHGRFTCLLLNSLLDFQPYFEPLGLPQQPFVYFFTDVVTSNFESLRLHPDLKLFTDKGWLQFASFDANNPPDLPALQTLARRAGHSIDNDVPTIIICNYVLDSLRQEVLQFGTSPRIVREGLLSVYSTQEEPTLHDPSLTSRLTFAWDFEKNDTLLSSAAIEDMPAAEEPPRKGAHSSSSSADGFDGAYFAVVREYLNTAREMTALFPIAGFDIVQTVRKIAGDRLLMLIGDKGHQDTSEFDGWREPHLAVHGSFSMMVNFHALHVFFEHLGGWSEHTPYHDVFQVAVYALGSRSSYPSLLSCLVDFRTDIGPGTMMSWSRHLLGLEQNQNQIDANLLAKAALALLRYGGHDPDLFWQFRSLIKEQGKPPHLNSRAVKDLTTDLAMVHRKQFRTHPANQDLPLAIGECLLSAGRASEASEFFRQSLQDHGPDAGVFVQLSQSLQAAGRRREALDAVREALNLVPENVEALRHLEALEALGNRLDVCLVGGGKSNLEVTGPMLARDVRFCIKAVFAFREEEAQRLAKMVRIAGQDDASTHKCANSQSGLGACPEVSWGSEGFQDILRRTDIEACVVDIHHKLQMALLPKLFAAGKHVLSQSPLAYALETARRLMESYQACSSPDGTLPAWHAIEAARHEEALDLAGNCIATIGRVLCISLVSTSMYTATDSKNASAQSSQLPNEEELALELVHCIAVVLKVTKERLASISVQTGQVAGAKVGKEAKELALVGHFSICPASSASTSIGTFVVCKTMAPPSLELRLNCTRGTLVLTRERSAWSFKVTGDRSGGFCQASLERSVHQQGYKASHDAFIQQIREKSENAVDVSVSHALADTAVLESIFASMSGDGATMTFKYAN